MFATRNDQENAIYARQNATAIKNDGVKGLAPKTPAHKAPKTPFGGGRNDENAAFGFAGKTGGKGQDGAVFGDGKGGKVDRSAFVTPAGPRTRAPLGNKTTNAKGNLLQTPAPASVKPGSPRLRRGKLKIHTADPTTGANGEPEEPEIEYMPPREVPLPDHPEDCWPHDKKYPQLEGKNFTRGWFSEFAPAPKGDDDGELSDLDQKLKKFEDDQERKERKKVQNAVVKGKPAMLKQTVDSKAPSTVVSRRAASAFGPGTAGVPSFAAPTAAAKARLPGTLASKKPTLSSTTSNPRHTAARVASNTTLGYSKGRSVSAARNPLSDIHKQPSDAKSSSEMPFGGSTALSELLGLGDMTVSDADGDEFLGGNKSLEPLDEDEALKDFQLDIPEL